MATLLKDIVPQILATDDWRVGLARNWQDVVGALKTRIRLEKIFEDTIVIGVYEYHWMQELYLLSPVLRDSINDFLGEKRINHVRFILVEDKERTVRRLVPKPLVRPKNSILTNAQKSALSAIADDSLKQQLTEYWGRCYVQDEKEVL